jgi:hypothetical protein
VFCGALGCNPENQRKDKYIDPMIPGSELLKRLTEKKNDFCLCYDNLRLGGFLTIAFIVGGKNSVQGFSLLI